MGSALGTLRELGLAESTLVVFTSDNGGSFGSRNAPLRGRKGTTWEGGMREPTVAWWPGTVPAGTASDEVATTMDLLPTFARLAGGDPPEGRTIDGRDIADLLLGGPDARSPHKAFFYYRQHSLRAVRSGRWKLTRPEGHLYDLDSDGSETTDVASTHPAVVERLAKYLDGAAADLGDGRDSYPRCRPPGSLEEPRTLLPRRNADRSQDGARRAGRLACAREDRCGHAEPRTRPCTGNPAVLESPLRE